MLYFDDDFSNSTILYSNDLRILNNNIYGKRFLENICIYFLSCCLRKDDR